MAKKGFAKFVLGVGAAAVAAKVAVDKIKDTKEKFSKEENDSIDAEIRKYNALFEKKLVEVEDEVFTGCEVKTIGSNAVIDLGLAVFEKDAYINFSSTASNVSIILPEGVNATCDITRQFSGVKNLVENTDEEGIHTVYIIGKAVCSNVEVIPVNFYIDEDDFEDDFEDIDDELADLEADFEDEDALDVADDDSDTANEDEAKQDKAEPEKNDEDSLMGEEDK